MITQESIQEVYDLIRPHIRRTPIIAVDATDFDLSGQAVTFKLELLQHAGSFKARGALSNLLTREVPQAGVVAASGGNHGAAVAFAAAKLRIPAKIFVPTVSSASKIARIKQFGADLVVTGERYADALAASEEWVAESGAMPVHAYNQRETLLGQGTTALEFEQQASVDTVLVAVGGGGFIGGIASWYAGRTRVVAVEPEAAPTLHDALAAGQPVDAPAGGIAADSLAPRQIGSLMFPIAQAHVAQSVLVTDKHIVQAQQMLWQQLRIATEPGGAAAFAALLSGRYQPATDERVGVMVCGGNTDAVIFSNDSD